MVRIIIKGGVWKNTEDEVLKAAIAKYGKNQWARISSLLVRKTPKQCKARWYEWLDPSIKKTEWSKARRTPPIPLPVPTFFLQTEDEKLLHLAKIMPTQWRSIAPAVGRTATQCLERYQKLLDEAEAKDNEELEDIRRLRPGEIDPDPETKPARPDPIDMDEDEKEMLSEARARLANTQGKKAKRKARERQLEEARRLAVLQKKRELKAAGIIMRSKTKRRGMDYNADIPFEKKPAPGFYDTSEEQAVVAAPPVGQSLRRLENKRKPEEEELERKKRQRKNKEGEHETKFMPARDAQIQKLKEAESIARRRKLVLPGAQVGEAELEEIVKIGQAGESAKALVGGGSDASGKLLSDYDGLEAARMARTPRTAPQQDTVMMEARNLRNMTTQQTPLLGDENTPLHSAPGGGTGFEGATPRHQVAFTPNPLATPFRQDGYNVGATPRTDGGRVAGTPMQTPLRDNLAINPADAAAAQLTSAKRALRAGFMSLPKPENNFELLVPDDEEGGEETAAGARLSEEDAAERDARIKRAKEEEERKALARRSQAVQLALPRPANVNTQSLISRFQQDINDDDAEAAATRLIDAEMAELLKHDAISYPLPGTTTPGGVQSGYVPPADEDMEAAKALIQQELAQMVGYPSANASQIREGLVALANADIPSEDVSWAARRTRLAYHPKLQRLVDPEEMSPEERVEGYSIQLGQYREAMTKVASKAAKAEKKLGVVLGGYQARGQALAKRLTDAFAETQQTQRELTSFSRLRTNESVMGPRRVALLKEEVDKLEQRERMLQHRYAELDHEKKESEVRVATLEEKVMAMVEALNEAQLAAMDEDDA
ncbi:hypothetical protein H1R20_g12689, partial [Candolleomyces eurysporus]